MSPIRYASNPAAAVRSIFEIEIPAQAGRALGVASFVAVIGLSAHVKFFMPGNPVPVTLQTMFVLLAGAMLGPGAATMSIGAYILMGLAGVPMFAGVGMGGLSYLLGATGGYLVGFVAAAWVVGMLAPRARSPWALLAVFGLGSALILTLGVVHLTLVMGLGFSRAVTVGAVPFLVGDAVKTATACLMYWVIRGRRAGGRAA